MSIFEVFGYVVFAVTTITVLFAGRGDTCTPVAWQSKIAYVSIAALIGAMLGAKALVPVFIIGGLICAAAPKVRSNERIL